MDVSLMSQVSSATNYADYMADLQRSVLRDRQMRGAAPDTLGVSVPMPGVSSVREFMDTARNWWSEVRKRKGPQGYDMADTPMEGSYIQRRYDFIAGEEAARKFAYDDSTGRQVLPGQGVKGKVTVGIGFNMDRPDAREVMSRALGFDDARFDEVYQGRKPLSEVEVRKLFDYNVREAEDVVSTRLKGVDLPEHRRIPLVSLAFNGPSLIGPKLTAAITSGDWGGALNEILFNSNRKSFGGLFSRRYREASMFSGGDVEPPKFADYMARVAPKSKLASAALNKPDV